MTAELERIAADMRPVAERMSEILGVPVEYIQDTYRATPQDPGIICIGAPEKGKPLTPDGAGALAKKLKELEIPSMWCATLGRTADCVSIDVRPLLNEEGRERTIAIMAEHMTELREALKYYNLDAALWRDTVTHLKHNGGSIWTAPKDPTSSDFDTITPLRGRDPSDGSKGNQGR